MKEVGYRNTKLEWVKNCFRKVEVKWDTVVKCYCHRAMPDGTSHGTLSTTWPCKVKKSEPKLKLGQCY